MLITVKLFASLKRGRFEEAAMDFPFDVTVGQIVRQLSLPEKEVSLIFVNGRHADLSSRLVEGDILALFPPIGGG